MEATHEEVPLNRELSVTEKPDFLEALWDVQIPDILHAEAYFQWLKARVELFLDELVGDTVQIMTYGGLIYLIRYIRGSMDRARMDHCNFISSHPEELNRLFHIYVQLNASPAAIVHAIEFAFSVWSMVDLGMAQAGLSPYRWLPDDSLVEAVEKYLPAVNIEDPINNDYDLEFADYFTLDNMRLLSGFKIQYTSNLLHHLQLRKLGQDHFSTEVSVFDKAKVSALRGIAHGGPRILQARASEALRTLGLLIRPSDVEPTPFRWLRQLFENEDVNPAGETPAFKTVRVREYRHWRTRLLRLENEFENSSPRTFLQWWVDKRRRREWFTFWVTILGTLLAIAALVLTVFSAVTGWISAREAIIANQKDDGAAASSPNLDANTTTDYTTASVYYLYVETVASVNIIGNNFRFPASNITDIKAEATLTEVTTPVTTSLSGLSRRFVTVITPSTKIEPINSSGCQC